MPYINRENRAALDTIIDGLLKRLGSIDAKKGDVNYTITRIVLETLNKDSYSSLSDCVGVLRDAATEIERRLLGPYEDTAIVKNGDLMCFQKPYALAIAPSCPNTWAPCDCNGDTCRCDPKPITQALSDEQFKEAEQQRKDGHEK